MKTVIVTVPLMPQDKFKPALNPVDGNKALEYDKAIYCPINGILAKTMKNGESIKVIYVMTTGENSRCEQNKKTIVEELEGINSKIGAALSYDTVEIEFLPTKKTYNKLITDLSDKIPDNAEIYADITFGSKPEVLSLFCALRFVEEFRDALVQFIVYRKAEFNKDNEPVNPMLFDITSLYYLFKLMGTMGAADADEAAKTLKDFFAI